MGTEQYEKFLNTLDFAGRPSQLDAFGNLRISDPVTLFDTQFQYGTFEDILWSKKVVGTGSITHLPNESSIQIQVGTALNDRVVWQSRRYIRYQPGKSQKIIMTTVFGAQKAGVTKRCGYFDIANGIFFEQTGTTVAVVLRSSATGVAVDNRVLQADWNYDKMDGTGPSGLTLDSSKAQIVFIDLEWLSVGTVRIGFVINGQLHYVHYFNHSNIITTCYMTTANLPVRYEILNTAITASVTSIKAICCSVQSEGGFFEEGYFSATASNGITAVSVTTRRPILSIRPKATFKGQVNRGDINPLDTMLTVASNSALIEIVVGGVLSGGAGAWLSAGNESITEYNVDQTTITGGRVIDSVYVTSGAGSTRGLIADTLKSRTNLSLDIDGANPTNLSVVATSLTGNASVLAALNWREIY